MTHLYNDYCPDCGDIKINLALNDSNPSFKELLKIAENAYKQLHQKGSYQPDDITQYSPLIDATHDILKESLKKGIADNVIPKAMRNGLENDIFIFSGLKTHAQLLEASRLLLTDDGKIKPFYQFSRDVAKINSNYNQLYLEAEYQFAVSSSQQAANWAKIEEGGSRYNIQYRTAGDDKVRDNHAVLNGITLAFEDEFWNEYYPPNGWRCRCRAIQVLKSKYPVTDSIDAITKGQNATSLIGKDGKNRLEIFRFNPGKQKVIFPPNHPYRKVQDAGVVKEIIKSNKKPFIPKGLNEYEKKLNIEVDKGIFEYLNRETPLHIVRPNNIAGKGAFYMPTENYVHIPIDQRRKRSPWYSKAVVYHEFGHAVDFQNNLRQSSEVRDLMTKYRKSLDFQKIEERLINFQRRAIQNKNYDFAEKIGAVADTLMSLNHNYGWGHRKSYYSKPGLSEAEFIAHAFENTFSGNEVFKKVMPELYEETIELVKSFKSK